MPAVKNKGKLFLNVFSLILLACLIFYANSLFNPFIWDDEGLIIKNTLIRNPQHILRVFTPDLYSSVFSSSNFYRPLQFVSFSADYRLWQLNPFGYHLTNIILQGLVSCCVFLFLLAICRKADISLAGALLFAVNPLHTEAVTYISGRADLLMGLFALLSLILFIRGRLALSLIAFALSLLSKELAVVFPAVIIAYAFFYSRENFKQPFYFTRRIVPFIALDLAYLALRIVFLKFTPFLFGANFLQPPFWLRMAVFPEVIFSYCKLLLLPLDLHMSRAPMESPDWARIVLLWLALSLIALFFISVLRQKKAGRNLCFMLVWALAFFLPQSGILPINAMVAEHFIYLSSISFFFLLAYLLRRYLRAGLFIFAVSGLVFFYGALTIAQNYRWRDPIAFYKRVIKFSPKSFMAHNNLRLQYERKGLYDPALDECKQALEIRPWAAETRYALAKLYYKTGKFPQAEQSYLALEKAAHFEKAAELQRNIGVLYEKEGRLNDALARFKLALRLDPRQLPIRLDIARLYLFREEIGPAKEEITGFLSGFYPAGKSKEIPVKIILEYLKEARVFDSAFALYNDLGIKFAGAGSFAEAEVFFQRLLEQVPDFAGGYFNLGLLYWKAGRLGEAEAAFRTALALDPSNDQVKCILAQLQGRK
ncbi:MAG: tetratricopeptide repeat protein [Candidatus Omnitrophota bacterium]|nr:tetratricopeptide repeat protein [Candidatus Omnitrophota bacterium]